MSRPNIGIPRLVPTVKDLLGLSVFCSVGQWHVERPRQVGQGAQGSARADDATRW